ncbi:protein phosphatase 2C 51-like isoform X2 [Vigna umbellata]|uniref:protein phosphatase 2C 51-like isoform X2 n=1 Tax=Vigna umbellata TaxID=87088 RepID=UPI001F5E5E39|nr:protein phosphatase 2C 51-like isoform X2 [Vigna umbellata]
MKKPKHHSSSANADRRVEPDSGEFVAKMKNGRQRRLKIKQMKYTCQAKIRIRNGTVGVSPTPAEDLEGGSREIHDRVEISLSLAAASSSSEEEERSLSEKNDGVLSYGSTSVIGSRKEMEDAVSAEIGFAAKEKGKYDFFAVYDGHGGAQVAKACRERLHRLVAEEVERSESPVEWDWQGVMEGCFRKMDSEVAGNAAVRTVGSTAVVAVIAAEELVVANCGDCRAVLGRGGEAVDLSSDHKPDRPDELMRIEEAGGRVINWNGQRVLGVLATSRSIGDQYLRPYVISNPEVTVTKRSSKDEFVILASDGLWDVMSSEVACQVVRKCLNGQIRRVCNGVGNHENRAAEAASLLAEIALAKGSKDNTSVIVVELRGTVT